MADVTIEGSATTYSYSINLRGGVFWKSTTVGYVIYVDSSEDLKYRKTSDGGATWGGATNIKTGTLFSYDCFADWQVAGDAGTKIHIAYIDPASATADIRYCYLDTADDSVGGDATVMAANVNADFGILSKIISITKARGGYLFIASRFTEGTSTIRYVFYRSTDSGANWVSKTSPWDADADYIQLYAGNEADTNDIWAIYWDVSADEISLKTYDDSANSWAETTISGAGNAAESGTYLQMDGQIRLSDGHLIFAYWNLTDNAAADLQVFDINGAASITAKTNVITNEAESAAVSVFVNQVNDDLYIAYCSGSVWTNTVAVFYQKSTNGGTNWGGETAMQADAEEDIRWVSAGCMKATLGGKFQPVWFDDDDNDLFTNTTNGVSIAAEAANYDTSASVLIGALVSFNRDIAVSRSPSVLIGDKITATRTLASARSVAVLIGNKVTATRVMGFPRSAVVAIGVKVSQSRAIASARSVAVLIGNKVTASRVIGFPRSAAIAVGVKVTQSRAVASTRNALVLIGNTVSQTRAYVSARAATILIGVKVTATSIKGFPRSATVLIGVSVSQTRAIATTRSAIVLIGNKVSQLRTLASTRANSIKVGVLATASGIKGFPRSAIVYIGVLTSQSRAYAGARAVVVLIGEKVSQTRVISSSRSALVLIGEVVSQTKSWATSRTATVKIGVTTSFTRLSASIRSVITLIGEKVSFTDIWSSAGGVPINYARSAIVYIGVSATHTRTLASARAATISVGIVTTWTITLNRILKIISTLLSALGITHLGTSGLVITSTLTSGLVITSTLSSALVIVPSTSSSLNIVSTLEAH